MVSLVKARKENGKEIAKFIAERNKLKEHHIGYCGEEEEEIYQSLLEDFSHVPFFESFVLAYSEDKQLIGVLGLDVDSENEYGELWGPFVRDDDWKSVAHDMWGLLIPLIPIEVKSISLFVNVENAHVIEFANALGFKKNVNDYSILSISKEQGKKVVTDSGINELQLDDVEAMKSLHDQFFPKSYYNGKQIIDRIDQDNKVFIYKENNEVAGYIYVEAQPDFGDGSIDFFAVKEEYRGLGIGKKLMEYALQWLFTMEKLDKIQLCVDSENNKAIRLYTSVGFCLENKLYSFEKNVRS